MANTVKITLVDQTRTEDQKPAECNSIQYYRDNKDLTPVTSAASIDDIWSMQELMKTRVDIVTEETLNFAVAFDRLGMVQFLCLNGSKVSEAALRMSVENGNIHMVRWLCGKNAPKSSVALKIALQKRNNEIVRTLLKHGCSMSVTALKIAVDTGHFENVQLLCNAGCDMSEGALETALGRVFVAHGNDASLDFIPPERIPFDVVRGRVNHDIIDYLCAKGSAVSDLALKIAIVQRNMLAVKRLCAQRSKYPLWLLNYARAQQYDAAVQWLSSNVTFISSDIDNEIADEQNFRRFEKH